MNDKTLKEIQLEILENRLAEAIYYEEYEKAKELIKQIDNLKELIKKTQI